MASPTSNYNSSDSLDSIMTDTALSELLPITFNFQPQYSTQQRDGKLMSLEYTLIEAHNRPKTYYQYTKELSAFYSQHKDKLNEATVNNLSNSLQWFALNFSRYGLLSQVSHLLNDSHFIQRLMKRDVFLRMYICSSLLKIQEDTETRTISSHTRKTITNYVGEAVSVLSVNDFIASILQDVIPWFEGLAGSGIGRFILEAFYTSNLLTLQKSYHELPCLFPTPFVEKRFTEFFLSRYSRADSYICLLSRVQNMANLSQNQSQKYNECHTYPKLAYLIRYIIKKIQEAPPPPSMITRLETEIGRLLRFRLPDDTCVHINDLLDVFRAEKVGYSLDKYPTHHLSKKILHVDYGMPQYAISQKKRSSVFNILRSKGCLIPCGYRTPLHHLINQEAQEHILQKGSVKVFFVSDTWLPSDIGAFLENIWFQVDPVPQRLLMKSQPINAETDRENLVSTVGGGLFFAPTEMIWCESNRSIDRFNQIEWNFKSGISIKYSLIKSYRILPVYVEKKYNNADEKFQRRKSNNMGASSLNIQEKKKIWQDMVFSLTLQLYGRHGREESTSTYSFYPFYREDLMEILKMLIAYTGQKPIDESERVKEILAYRMDQTRQEIIIQLLQQENPWIENYNDLKQVVLNLTNIPRPPSLYELERLFHSCRRERDVARETLDLLRGIWHQTSAETIRLRVLTVLERLIDPSIMQAEDMVFKNVYKWLTQLEETINPYKSPESVRLVNGLIERMTALRADPLPQLGPNLNTKFDHWDEFQSYRQEYTDFKTFPLWRPSAYDVLLKDPVVEDFTNVNIVEDI